MIFCTNEYRKKQHNVVHPMTDVIIIGGGIIGNFIAYELSKLELSCLLLEKETELSFGVSKSNSGIIHTGFQAEATTLKARLAVMGNGLYEEIAKKLNFPFKRIGELIVGFNEEDLATIKDIFENGKKLKIPNMKLVDRLWISKNEPNLSPEIKYALLGESAAIINPYETVYALAENAQTNGCKIKCDQKVTSINKTKKGWEVITSDDIYQAKYVVNAAGLFADEIAKMANIKSEAIIPKKGEEFLLDKHAGLLSKRIIFPVPNKESKGILVIRTIDDNFMIGPTAETISDKEDLQTSLTGKEKVLKNVKKLIPSISEKDIIASFSGLRPTTASGDFYIKEDETGFINLIGIQSPGLTAAPAIALMVKHIILNTKEYPVKPNYEAYRPPVKKVRHLNHKELNILIKENPEYGEIVCRCEQISKGEILDAIRHGAKTLDGIKFRTRSQMGRCHGTFCTIKIAKIMANELNIPLESITKRGEGSEICYDRKL